MDRPKNWVRGEPNMDYYKGRPYNTDAVYNEICPLSGVSKDWYHRTA